MSCEYGNISRHRQNLESTILIWLMTKPNEVKLDQLRNVIDYVQVLDSVNTCDDQIYVVTDTSYHILQIKHKCMSMRTMRI